MKTQKTLIFSSVSWLWATSLILVPLLYIFVVSFLTKGTYGGIEWVATTKNYTRLMDSVYVITFFRSITMALLTTLACALLSYPLTLFLVYKSGKWRTTLFYLLIIPFWTNFLIRTYAWVVLLSDNGWINNFLHTLGFEEGLNLLFTPQAVAIGMIYNYLPYMAMSLYLSFEKLDLQIINAATDLGAAPLRVFFKVLLPLSFPGLIAGSVMVFIPSLGEYVIPDILGGGQTIYVGNMIATQFMTLRNWPMGCAISSVLILLIFMTLLGLSKRKNKVEVMP